MTQSAYGDYFNHDDEASGYDQEVRNEAHPIRAGYQALQDWVGHQAHTQHYGAESLEPQLRILELGCGTGNTTALLPRSQRLYAVDISERMLEKARQKLKHHEEIEWIQQDLLAYTCAESCPRVHLVVSCYALHHLTPAEKKRFLARVPEILEPGGQLIVGDLMFPHPEGEQQLRQRYPELTEAFDEEFFWDLKGATQELEALGFECSSRRFSDLSWGFVARLPEARA